MVTYASEVQAQKAVAMLQESVIPGNERYIALSLKAVPHAATGMTAKMPKTTPMNGVTKQGAKSPAPVTVRGFDFDTTEEAVREHCATAGKVLSVEMRRGMAVVTYASQMQAQKAVATLHESVIDGNDRYIEVKLRNVESQAPPSWAANGVGAQPTKKRKAKPSEPSCKVFVRGFDKGTPEEAVLDHFGSIGEILESEIKNTCAILTFSNEDEANEAVSSLNKSTIEGNSRYIMSRLMRGKSPLVKNGKVMETPRRVQVAPTCRVSVFQMI